MSFCQPQPNAMEETNSLIPSPHELCKSRLCTIVPTCSHLNAQDPTSSLRSTRSSCQRDSKRCCRRWPTWRHAPLLCHCRSPKVREAATMGQSRSRHQALATQNKRWISMSNYSIKSLPSVYLYKFICTCIDMHVCVCQSTVCAM